MMNEPLLCGMAQTTVDRPTPLLRPGNTNCGGCGTSSLLQMMRRAVADRPVQLIMPACCAAVAAGSFPQSAYGAPALLTTFASFPVQRAHYIEESSAHIGTLPAQLVEVRERNVREFARPLAEPACGLGQRGVVLSQ